MIKKLKRKFVASAMLCVLAVFMVLLVGINVFFSQNLVSTSDSLLKLLVNDNMQPFSDDGANHIPADVDKLSPDEHLKYDKIKSELSPVPETRGAMRYFSVEYNSNGEAVSSNTEHIISLSETDALAMAAAVEKIPDGKIKWYKDYRYTCSETADGYKMVFLNCELVRYSLNSLRLYSALIAAASYALIFLIVVLTSGRVIKPISSAYEKQKRFITDASHELKTPLTVISANNELQELNGMKTEYTAAISDEVKHMTDLVGQLVVLSRYDEENLQLNMLEFSLSEAVIDTAGAFVSVAKRSGRKLIINVQPDINISGDEAMIRRLISILMDNALKYCDADGEIDVMLTCERKTELTVMNTYKNVANVSLEHLFDRFYREDKARTAGKGYGLGLSIARAVASSHHASIKAHDAGSGRIAFTVTF